MKKIILTIFLIPLLVSANDQKFGAGLTLGMTEGDTIDYGIVEWNIPMITGSVQTRTGDFGYEIKLGLGISDDSDKDVDGDSWSGEINSLLQLKGLYHFSDDVYGAILLTRLDAEVCADWAGECASDNDTDFGFQIGIKRDEFDIFFGPSYDSGDFKLLELGFTYWIPNK